MDVLYGAILGIVQGLTEFLPVSSSGHLVLAQSLLGFAKHDLFFDVIVHLASLLSVFTVMRSQINTIFSQTVLDLKNRRFGLGLNTVSIVFVATLPAVFAGLFLKSFFENLFSSLVFVGSAFLFTGVLLYCTRFVAHQSESMAEEIYGEKTLRDLKEKGILRALLVGLAQVIAICPGVSRAGSTISAGMFLGIPNSAAATLSFLMVIPAILGAVILELREVSIESVNFILIGSGFIASYFSGVFALRLVLRMAQKGKISRFAFYLIPLGIFTLIYSK
ncbi:MAG: undecaprenyl-diphosphate phosphatase [Bdellovibrionales bacterium]|nr:undecaprenyl-diphosphate phosphatase [Bdellovibrionales bacterium]